MTDPELPSSTGVPAAGVYRLDTERSTIAFTTRHLFGLATVRGTFAPTGGDISVAADSPQDSTVRASAGAATFDTGDRRRDTLITGRRFLDAGAHPELSFRSTDLSADEHGTWTVHGEATAVGRTAPIDLTVTRVRQDGDDLELVATGTVDRYAHGLTAARGLAARRLQITLSAYARR